jgi:hypothetical protein
VILNVDSWIALPGCSINPVTAAGLTGFAKVELAHLTQVSEGYAVRVSFHQVERLLNPRHVGIVSILISSVKVDLGAKVRLAGAKKRATKTGSEMSASRNERQNGVPNEI